MKCASLARILSFIIALVLPSADAQFWSGQLSGNSLYIAPSGSDSNPCSIALPCQSIGHVQTVVRGLVGAMNKNINVYLRAGTYTLSSTWSLGSADSGQNGFQVNWLGYSGETAIISGGTAVTGWTLVSGSIFKASVGSVDFRQLYVNGAHAQRARGAASPSGWSFTSTGYTAPDTTVAGYGNLTNVEIVSIGHWAMERCLIASAAGTTITMQTPCFSIVNTNASTYGWSSVAWVENAFELMASGYWYLDKSAGFVYYWPPGGTMTGVTVVAPSIAGLISISGASNLTISNLTLAYSNWIGPNNSGVGYPGNIAGWYLTTATTSAPMDAAVSVNNSSNITISQMEFTHLGGSGVQILSGNSNVNVLQSRFDDVAGQGVNVGVGVGQSPSCPATTETGVTIRNNIFAGTNYFMYTDAVAIVLGCSTSAVVDHNEIDSPPAFGVWIGSFPIGTAYNANAAITNNEIFAACNTYTDCGGVYAESTQSSVGSFPTGLQVSGDDINGNGTFAGFGCLYADQGSTWETWTGNVCRNSPKFIHIPFSSATNLSFTGNYYDGGTIVNNGGSNVTISGNTASVTGAAALAIIAGAGVQPGVLVGPH